MDDLDGKTFGWLRAIALHGIRIRGKHKVFLWKCVCSYKGCGNIAIIAASSLKYGLTTSCGCRNRELAAERCRNNKPALKKRPTRSDIATGVNE